MRPLADILADIVAFQRTTDGNWLALDDLLSEVFAHTASKEAVAPVFHLLERFPADDSAGVLWSALHGLESVPDYEAELVKSLHRHPAELTLTMVHRIANGGQKQIAGHPIQRLYELVLAHPKSLATVKDTAQEYLNESPFH